MEEDKIEDGIIPEETEDLAEVPGGTEYELPPPEENEAKKINASGILMILGTAVLIVILVIVLVSHVSKAKKTETDELDRAGSKFIPAIGLEKNNVPPPPFLDEEEENMEEEDNDKNIDEIISTLPPEFHQEAPGTAPVFSSPSSSSVSSTRPDTRNSISIRRIEGLAGRDDSSSDRNREIISDVLSGNYRGSSYTANAAARTANQGSQMTRDEYIADILSQSTRIASSYGSSQSSNAAQTAQSARESFYNAEGTAAGNGRFLPYASLWDGTVITGSLITGINTDNPGAVIARVTENVYSSLDSSLLLIPQGTLLFAEYNSSISYGQDRVQIAWNLLIRPDGYRLELGNMNGTDAQGYSGVKGSVTNHPFETLKAMGLVAMFSIIQTEVTSSINSEDNEYVQNLMSDVYGEASRLGNRIIDRALDIKPTIKLRQGTEIKIITNAPLELPPVKANQVTEKYVRQR